MSDEDFHLRWHRLAEIYYGNEPSEVIAAVNEDGICALVKWEKVDGEWRTFEINTETADWRRVDCPDSVPEEPPVDASEALREQVRELREALESIHQAEATRRWGISGESIVMQIAKEALANTEPKEGE